MSAKFIDVTAPLVWFHRSHAHSNMVCPYCARRIDDAIPSDKEHLVGRNFVPKGTLAGAFNFIFRACRECNALKAHCEDHISSVSLYNGIYDLTDPKLQELALHKSKNSFHPTKGKPVHESHEKINVTGSLGPMTVTFGLISPPQLEENRTRALAFFHIMGLARS